MTLDKFIALLALDPDRRQRFLADSDAELAAAGLDSAEVHAMAGALERICQALGEHDYPPPNVSVGGPSG